jgi:hypothetical protein
MVPNKGALSMVLHLPPCILQQPEDMSDAGMAHRANTSLVQDILPQGNEHVDMAGTLP